MVSFNPELLGHPDNNIPANPYSTPAHIVPEWYFRAPLCRLHCCYLMIVCTVVLICIKALSPYGTGNGLVRSGNESDLRVVGTLKNSPQATSGMTKIMNLIYNPAVPPFTVGLLLLRAIVGHEHLPESEVVLWTADLGNIHRMYWMQGSNPDKGSVVGTVGLPKERKFYGNRERVIVLKNEGVQSNFRSQSTSIIPVKTKHGCRGYGRCSAKHCRGLTKLRLRNTENPESINRKLIHLIRSMPVLQLAYELIKSKPGNMTPGIGHETLDGIDLPFL